MSAPDLSIVGPWEPQPARKSHPSKGKKFPAEALTRKEVDAILRAAWCVHSNTHGMPYRRRGQIITMWRAGLRISEMLDLRRCDLDVANSLLRVLKPKGANGGDPKCAPRILGADATLMKAINAWLRVRPEIARPTDPLFCTLKGTRDWKAEIRKDLLRMAEKANIVRRVTPHMFRHTFATELAMDGVPLISISKALGHRNLEETARYIHHLYPKEMVAMMQARTG